MGEKSATIRTVHVGGAPPTPRQLAGQFADVAVAVPLGLFAPLSGAGIRGGAQQMPRSPQR